MSKKKMFFIVSGGLLAALFLVVVFTQVIFTINVTPASVECVRWDATYTSVKATADRYNAGQLNDYEHAYSFTGELPSENPEDYITIYCYFDVENTGYIDQYVIDATLKKAKAHSENILFVSDAIAAYSVRVFRNSTKQANITLDVYIGNLTEAEITELVNGLSISVKAQGEYFGNRTRTISYAKCDNISIQLSPDQAH